MTRHVLIAEDDADMRALVALTLRRDGYFVEEVRDGWALLASLEAPNILLDLVITDIRMPGLSGLDVVERIRTKSESVPVIVMTAFGDEEARATATRLGAVLIDKPFSMDALRTAVCHVLRE